MKYSMIWTHFQWVFYRCWIYVGFAMDYDAPSTYPPVHLCSLLSFNHWGQIRSAQQYVVMACTHQTGRKPYFRTIFAPVWFQLIQSNWMNKPRNYIGICKINFSCKVEFILTISKKKRGKETIKCQKNLKVKALLHHTEPKAH